MTLAEKKNILLKLGSIFEKLGVNSEWPGYEIGINNDEFAKLNELITTVHVYNGWFKEEQVRKALLGISSWLTKDKLDAWLADYDLKEKTNKRVAIIMAGNIPLVGFHDLISVFLSGHRAIVKMSSDDKHLLPAIIHTLALFDEGIWEEIELAENQIKDFNAVIATGSDNSSKYFESYFGKHPNIIRKNRSSIAVLDGTETKEEMYELGKDIFDYYGLGCRNVAQIWVPQEFALDRFFEAIYDFKEIVNHNKYANNYDYNKAVKLLNEESLLDNGFLLLKEDASLNSPLAVLHYQRYADISEVEEYINENKEKIQVVIGKDHLPFGSSQKPTLTDYADGINTLKFLTSLY
jgi:hypothetical protein